MKVLKLSNSSLGNQSIEILIPTDKDNLYYEPTEKLHKFDLLQVSYIENDKKTFFKEDILSEIVLSFLNFSKRIINNEVELLKEFEPGSFGYFYNQLSFDPEGAGWDILSIHLLWGGINVLVVMYSCNQSVYLEIFPIFNNFSEDESEEEDKANFKKFMENYAPIGVMKLDKDILLQWRQQVRDFFELKNDTIPY